MGVDREPGQVHRHAAQHVGRLAADAGERDEVLHRGSGTSPPKRSTTPVAMPMRLLRLLLKKPVERMISSTSAGSATARSSGVGYFANRCGRHHVHPLVGALGRQDRGGEQLVGVAVVERAQLLGGAGVLLARGARGCGEPAPRRCAAGARRGCGRRRASGRGGYRPVRVTGCTLHWVTDGDDAGGRGLRGRTGMVLAPRAAPDAPAPPRRRAGRRSTCARSSSGRTRRPGSRSTTAPSRGTPSRAAGPSTRAPGRSRPSRGSTRRGSCSTRTDGRLARLLLDEGPRRRRAAARRDLRDRRRPRRAPARARPARSSSPASTTSTGRGCGSGCSTSTPPTTPPCTSTGGSGFEVHHVDRAYASPARAGVDHPLRRRPRRASTALLAGEPRYRVDQVWTGPVRAAGRAGRAHEPAQAAAGPARRRAARRRSSSVTEQHQRRRRDGEVAVGAGRRHAGRDRAHALRRPLHRVRVEPGRLRDGRAGSAPPARPASTATSPPARSSSRSCGPPAGPATTAGGCPTSCSWAWASRSPTTTPRGRPSSASTATSACRPATSRCRRSASCRASAASPPRPCR